SAPGPTGSRPAPGASPSRARDPAAEPPPATRAPVRWERATGGPRARSRAGVRARGAGGARAARRLLGGAPDRQHLARVLIEAPEPRVHLDVGRPELFGEPVVEDGPGLVRLELSPD